jgi:hypothetical protein
MIAPRIRPCLRATYSKMDFYLWVNSLADEKVTCNEVESFKKFMWQ